MDFNFYLIFVISMSFCIDLQLQGVTKFCQNEPPSAELWSHIHFLSRCM